VAVWKAAAQARQSERRDGRLQGAFRSCFKGTMADVVGCNRGNMGYKFPMKYLEPGFNQPSTNEQCQKPIRKFQTIGSSLRIPSSWMIIPLCWVVQPCNQKKAAMKFIIPYVRANRWLWLWRCGSHMYLKEI
jgi:hypothetical protein